MANEKCGCGGDHQGGCQACGGDVLFDYWCDTCKRSVVDKRCPYCGLKTQRKK